MLWWLFFCQALKHSGRLIKSVPQAAAPIGSHYEKYTQSLSYITRKMRGCFEVRQSSFLFFFSSIGSLQEGSWSPDDGTVRRRGEMKEAYCNVVAAWSVLLDWVCPLAPTSPLFSPSVPQAEGCSKWQSLGLGEWVSDLPSDTLSQLSLRLLSRCQLLTPGESWGFPVLAHSGHLMVCCWQTMAVLNGQTLSPVTAPWCANGAFLPLFNL